MNDRYIGFPMIRTIYPHKRLVDASKIFQWAKDAYASGDTDTDPHTIAEAIAILEDLGYVTFTKEIDSLIQSPIAYRVLD